MRSSEEEYVRQTQTKLKERLNTYRHHTRQPELQKQIDVCSGSDKDMCWCKF